MGLRTGKADGSVGQWYGFNPAITRARAIFSLKDPEISLLKSPRVIRVRRSSDNTARDFTAAEYVSGEVESWVGSNDGFLVRWYDITGNGFDAIQNDPARQPQLVSNGVLESSVDVSNTAVYLDIPAITSEGTLITVTESGTYRVAVNLDGSSHRIYTYHIWGIEQLIYFDRVIGDEEYENILSALETLGFTVQANFGTNWTDAFRERADFAGAPDIDYTGVTGLTRAFGFGGGDWLSAETNYSFPESASSVTNFTGTFARNTSITSVPENLFANCPNATVFGGLGTNSGAFEGCSNLTSVPENLFANNPNVTVFGGIFRSAGLTSVPENLFANNPNVTSFGFTLRQLSSLTSVPESIFANNPKVTDFRGTLSFCPSLTSVPENLFANCPNVTSITTGSNGGLFSRSGLQSVPENLFATFSNVTNFAVVFDRNNLTSIPENLFANCPNVTNFSGTFRLNNLTSIPENLFANCPNVTNFSETFRLNNLTSIPENLFANCPNVTNFSETFINNPNLTAVPAGVFDNQTLCLNYEEIFDDCALTQQSVDNVLVSINNSAQANNITNGRVDITGGTNSPPGTAGNNAIAALETKGWTVNVNS